MTMLTAAVTWQWPERQLLQITDCHLLADPDAWYREVQPYRHLAQLLAQFREAPLPLVLTGDLSEDHSVESYERLHELLHDWPAPVYVLPGNHDDLALMQQVLVGGAFVFAGEVDAAQWRLLLLDTRSVTPAGQFDAPKQHLLATQLSRAADQGQHVWLFCHHHPHPIGGIIDQFMLQDAAPFCAQLTAAPHVKGLSHGHCHYGYVRQQVGWQLIGCPASSIQYLPKADWVSVDAGPQACWYQFADDGAVTVRFIKVAAPIEQS